MLAGASHETVTAPWLLTEACTFCGAEAAGTGQAGKMPRQEPSGWHTTGFGGLPLAHLVTKAWQ